MSQSPLDPQSHDAPERAARRALPRCRLVLHYNSSLDLLFVVRTLMEVLRLGRAEATHKMWESYHSARSILVTTYKERAELLHELLGARGLKVALEPLE